ncbi:MAG: hypothetical protein K0M66_06180 [Thiobacillus sp.]|nr:hypothetical protein [Thiobacillus sp.]
MAARMMLWALAALLAPPLAAASLPDPTALPKSLSSVPAGASSEEAGLAWVRVDGPRSIAWYGGTTVKVGDSVVGGRVVAIREDHIVISGKDGRRTVYLLDRSIAPQSRTRLPAR